MGLVPPTNHLNAPAGGAYGGGMRVILLAVVMLGCGPSRLPGPPVVGSACAAGSAGECTTSASVAYCEEGKWAEYACPSECRNAQEPRCNWELSGLGDTCPKSFEGSGFCATALRLFVCSEGKYVARECPGGCAREGDVFSCRP
jgi:hypothetical protein